MICEPYCYHAKLNPEARQWDGDTIRIDIDLGFDAHLINQAVRLARIDAPERKGETYAAAIKSLDYLVNELIGDRPFLIRTEQLPKSLRGKFGRFIVEVYVNTQNGWECANDLLVMAGHAIYKSY